MRFDVLEYSLEVIHYLRGVLPRIRSSDSGLYRQMRAAASSVALNVAEGNRRLGGDRKHLWRIAAGSAAELRVALRVAEAWGYVDPASIAPALGRLDSILAMLWRLTK